MQSNMWRKSLCNRIGFLHNYRFYDQKGEWVREVCTRCRNVFAFRDDLPGYQYYERHLREGLQKHHPRFRKEYQFGIEFLTYGS